MLFQRLSTAAGSDLEASLAYELCTYPPALFESPNLLLEPQKATLADAIWNFAKPDQCTVPARALTVLDGGALLHRLPWKRGSSFFEILCKYTEYVKNRYPNVTVVFDGYETASTKDMTHRWRNKGKQGVTAAFTKDMKLAVSKEVFLSNKKNKQKFIHMLGNELQMNGCSVFHEKADADYSIVQKTIQYTDTQAAVLVGDDTDLLILLLYHAGNLGRKVYFASEPKKNSKSRVWDISEIQMKLGPYLCNQMLYIHAMLGCDTTFRFRGIGKGAFLKKIRSSKTLQQSAKVFDSPRSTKIDIEKAGEIAIVELYGGKRTDTLNHLRHKKFCEKAATNITRIEPQTLPPTSAAAKYHSFRVFYQIVQWKGSPVELLPEEWGWIVTENGIHPTPTDIAAAPDSLLKVIRCSCKTDCKSQRCSCRKHDLKCTLACTHCCGTDCQNASLTPLQEDEPDEDDPLEV